MSDPSELILVEEIALGIFIKGDSREARRQSTIIILRYIGNDRDSGRYLIDVVVREGYAHGAGADVARCTARRRAWFLITTSF